MSEIRKEEGHAPEEALEIKQLAIVRRGDCVVLELGQRVRYEDFRVIQERIREQKPRGVSFVLLPWGVRVARVEAQL